MLLSPDRRVGFPACFPQGVVLEEFSDENIPANPPRRLFRLHARNPFPVAL